MRFSRPDVQLAQQIVDNKSPGELVVDEKLLEQLSSDRLATGNCMAALKAS